MTSTAISGYFPSELGRRPTVDDPVFPVLPFAGVLAVAQEQDWHAERLFPRFCQADPQTPPYCSYAEAREGLQLALRRHRGLELALLSGARKSVPHFGVMGLGLMSEARLGEALHFGLRYQLVAGSMLEMRVEQDGDEAAIAAHALFDDPETQPFLDIDHLATALNAMRHVPARRPPGLPLLKRVELAFEAPSLGSGLQALFEAPVVFGQARSRIVFDAAALTVPLSFHNRASVEISRQACERELASLMLSGLPAAAAPSALMRGLYDPQGRLLPLPAVAEKLDLSLRSLHRALAREGIRYSALLDEQQKKRAQEMLMRGASTSAVAESLAFSDPRSFVRAFERWTGESPAAWRRRQSEPA